MTKSGSNAWTPLFAAFVLAIVASLVVLFVGEVLGQLPCNLCWFQRAFMFPLAIILGIAAFRSDAGGWIYGVPLATGGWLVAGFHTLLYFGLIPETLKPCLTGPSCSSGDMNILGVLPLPVLSLVAFTAIIALLVLTRRRSTS